jgi:hypothetical protein
MKASGNQILAIGVLVLFAVSLYGQESKPIPRLVDSFTISTSEERSLFLDLLFSEIEKDPGAVGYITIFCGKTCRYGEVEAHLRGIEMKINFRGFSRNKIKIINGGFRETFTTELWVVPKGACAPPLNSTLSISQVKFSGTFKSKSVPYDCCY